jgi:hypothetical protein
VDVVVVVSVVVVAVVVDVVVVDVVVLPSAYAEAAPAAARRTPRTKSHTPRRIAPVCPTARRGAEIGRGFGQTTRLEAVADRHTIGDVDAAQGAGRNEHGAEPSAPLRYGQVIQGISAVIAPATLLTGIAFYFGWERVRAYDGYFGLNPGAVGYSTRDYVLNSLDALFLPVMVVLLALIALAVVHAYIGRVHRAGRRPHTLRWLSELGLWFGTLLLVVGGIGAFGAFPFHTPYLIATLFPAAGVLLLAHSVDLRARIRGDEPISPAGRVFVGLFVAVCLFWAAGLYAGTVGRNQAASLARHLDALPGVTMSGGNEVVSAGEGGVSTGAIAGARTHMDRSFRLLAVANGTLFLLPSHWKATRGKLFAVPEADAKGLAFTPGKVYGASAFASGGTGGEAVSGGCTTCITEGTAHKVGVLTVRIDTAVGASIVVLANHTSSVISRVSLVGTVRKHVHPFVVGSAAACRLGDAGFTCRVNPIRPGDKAKLRIGYTANTFANGRLTVHVGAAHKTLAFTLSR